MKYPDGQDVRLGDTVKMWANAEGVVVCSMDTKEFSDDFPEAEWGYLKKGVLIQSAHAGLVHYPDADNSIELIRRKRP